MRKLVMWNLITLDGYFEGEKSWDLSWHEFAWGDELENLSNEQLKTVGALLFGRVTYDGMAAYWSKEKGITADFMNSLPKIVFSKTLQKAEWNNSKLIKENVAQEIEKLKEQDGKDLFVFGSANLSATLLEHDLFDELRICVVPVILGKGNSLFKPNQKKMKLKLLDSKQFKTGCVVLRYQVEKGSQ